MTKELCHFHIVILPLCMVLSVIKTPYCVFYFADAVYVAIRPIKYSNNVFFAKQIFPFYFLKTCYAGGVIT